MKTSFWIALFPAVFFSICIGGLADGRNGSEIEGEKAVSKPERVFIFRAPIKDLKEFEKLAAVAAKMKPHGRVTIDVAHPAVKAFHEFPEGGSSWHDYACYKPSFFKFYPPAKLAPFIPADYVKKNRELLEGKAKILRKHGFGAAFWCWEPYFQPEAFFQAYPNLRGARVDHPRRSRKEAFSPCMNVEENREMLTQSVAELIKDVPEVQTVFLVTNDAGSGLCWSSWQYSGPNGPDHCRDLTIGQRTKLMMDAINAGVEKSDGKVNIYVRGVIVDDERRDIERHLPENCQLRGRDLMGIGAGSEAPIMGIFNPLALLNGCQRFRSKNVKYVSVGLTSLYERGGERLDNLEFVLDVVDDFLRDPAYGLIPRLKKLRQLCDNWGGPEDGERLFDAFVRLDQAMRFNRQVLPNFSIAYAGVSTRLITRPLVVMPDKLSPEEEAYFLPHVFNIHTQEARMDYLESHGGRRIPSWLNVTDADPRARGAADFRRQLSSVIRVLEDLDGAPEAEFLKGSAQSLRIFSSFVRSIDNFFAMQILRDRNAGKLSGPERIPPKVGTKTGDPDLLMMVELMRDELDNTNELIAVLENGGIDRVNLAKTPELEDTFLLGPDLIEQLKKKRVIMRRHWLDAEKHMATPLK